jgi:hypothetical protein
VPGPAARRQRVAARPVWLDGRRAGVAALLLRRRQQLLLKLLLRRRRRRWRRRWRLRRRRRVDWRPPQLKCGRIAVATRRGVAQRPRALAPSRVAPPLRSHSSTRGRWLLCRAHRTLLTPHATPHAVILITVSYDLKSGILPQDQKIRLKPADIKNNELHVQHRLIEIIQFMSQEVRSCIKSPWQRGRQSSSLCHEYGRKPIMVCGRPTLMTDSKFQDTGKKKVTYYSC